MKKQIFVMVGIIVAVLILFSIRTVTSQASCNGQYNLQLRGNTLPENAAPGVQTKIFVLPEVGGLQKIWNIFSVSSAKVLMRCSGSGSCSVYINNQPCGFTIPVGAPLQLTDLPCPGLFRGGVNTFDMRGSGATGELDWLFLETKVDSVWCW